MRLGFAPLDEKKIARGIGILANLLETELSKRWRGARREEPTRVALV
jgi:hypothetical protein